MDICDKAALLEAVGRVKPDVVFHIASYGMSGKEQVHDPHSHTHSLPLVTLGVSRMEVHGGGEVQFGGHGVGGWMHTRLQQGTLLLLHVHVVSCDFLHLR